ncbi:MAG TPA: DUF6498-containing protein [Chthoniobacterales bacterium]|jgi:hypothetical protein
MRIRGLITALGLNAIPAAGWFLGDWSAGTTLVLYWIETLLGTLLVGARILLHRRLRPSKGHWSYQAPQTQPSPGRSTYLTAFLVPALVFTLAHGVFLAALGFMAVANHFAPEARVEPGPLLVGLSGLVLFQGADFCLDLIWLRDCSFAWLERLGQQTLGRVFVIHLTIIGGMMAVMFTGVNRHFFGVFIFLKTLLNCSVMVPQWQPKTPPVWLSKAMDHMKAPKNKNTTFAEFWKQTDDQEAARVARNETPSR